MEALRPEFDDGGEEAPGLAEDGGPARHGGVIPTQRVIHGKETSRLVIGRRAPYSPVTGSDWSERMPSARRYRDVSSASRMRGSRRAMARKAICPSSRASGAPRQK